MAKQWVRWYVEFLHDPKRTVLTVAEQGIWSLLLLLAGASSGQDGRLRVCEGVPYTPESLAAALGLRPEDVTLVGPALEKFQRLRMIDIDEDGTIVLLNYEKRQYDHPSDRPEATRARKAVSRQLKKEVTSMSRACHEEVTSMSRPLTEQNRSEQNRSEQRSINDQSGSSSEIDLSEEGLGETLSDDAADAELFLLFEKEIGRPLSPMEVDQINNWLKNCGPELTREALRRAVLRGKLNFRYIDRILLGWQKQNLRTMCEVAEKDPLDRESQAAGQNGGTTADPRPRADPETERRQWVQAAVQYIRSTVGEKPDREKARRIAEGYGPDVAVEVMKILFGGDGHGKPG